MGQFNSASAIKTFQSLITEIPPLNRQLLLYILDLLAVFASKSDINHMNAPNLATIFQPGLLSHPNHNMAPAEYRLSQDVLIFLIDNQDNFLVGMQGTAADEKTIQEVSNGAGVPQRPPLGSHSSSSSRHKAAIGRSASNASAGADSLRKFGGVRRNVSTSSKRSRHSGQSPSPVTPPAESPYNRSSGVHRSNTVPSKKSQSPSVGTTRFEREKSQRRSGQTGITGAAVAAVPQTGPTPPARGPSAQATPSKAAEAVPRPRPTQAKDPERLSPHLRPVKDKHAPNADRQLRMDLPPSVFGPTSPGSGTSPRERPFSNYFGARSPSAEPGKDGRKPNKLQKRRPDGPQGLGTQASNPSLSGASHPPSPAAPPQSFTSPRSNAAGARHAEPPSETIDQMREPTIARELEKTPKPGDSTAGSAFTPPKPHTQDQPPEPQPQRSDTIRYAPPPQSQSLPVHLKDTPNRDSNATIKPQKPSPDGSPQSHSYSTAGDDFSSRENTDDDLNDQGLRPKREKKHSRWRLSTSARKEGKDSKASTSPQLGGSTDADRSTSSVGSFSKMPRKSFTDESKESAGYMTAGSEHEGGATEKKGGPIGWIKRKLDQREAEKERAKSPPPPAANRTDAEGQNRSLDAAVVASGAGTTAQGQNRGRSTEAIPENSVPDVR